VADIQFNAGLDPSKLSGHSREVLTYFLDVTGNPSCVVTCFGRTPREQAQVMHDNCIRHGTDAQLAIYLPPGQSVIKVFIADIHKSEADTVADMEAEIIRQVPRLVSRHCGDQSVLQVIDIGRSSLANPEALETMMRSHGQSISKCLDENGACHVEIPQPTPGAV